MKVILTKSVPDVGRAGTVLNFAPGGPKEGTITSMNTSSWVAGKTTAALRGSSNTSSTSYNYVDTGWNGAFTGDFTAAWFMKNACCRTGSDGSGTYVRGLTA